jgi:hypothetical protein
MSGTAGSTNRGRQWLIVLPWLVNVALFAVIVAIAVAAAAFPDFGMDVATAGFLVFAATWSLVQGTVGTAIAWRRPDNRIGRLMQLTGPLIVSVFIGFLVGAIRYLTEGPSDLLGGLAAWWGGAMLYPVLFLAFPALALLFPDGHLPGPEFRGPVAAILAVLLVVVLPAVFARGQVNEGLPDNPFGFLDAPPGVLRLLVSAGGLALVASMVVAIAGVAVRWRRGSAIERAQLKWLLAPLALGVASFGFAFGSSLTDFADLVSFISALLIPVAIGIAVLRYRLYEIDRLISRTVSWALISATLVALFAVAVVALQGALANITQGQTIAVASSTLLAAAAFQPLRRRVQTFVDRRFDRAAYDAQRIAEGFAERIRNEVDLGQVRGGLTAIAVEAVRPVGASVWLRASPAHDEAGR